MMVRVDDAPAQIAGNRSTVYALLARIYRGEVDTALVAGLRGDDLKGALADLGAKFDDDLYSGSQEELVTALAEEFSTLFLGPGPHISPHESVHHEIPKGRWGGLWGDSTVAVNEFMKAFGLAIREDERLIPDHISVELEFMERLAAWEEEAWTKGDKAGALDSIEAQKRFLDEHLSRWAPLFCAKVIDKAGHSLYREMARITTEFIAFDLESLNSQ